MKLIDKNSVRQAKEAARNTFNSLPFETRKKLARYIAKHFFQLGLNTQKGD